MNCPKCESLMLLRYCIGSCKYPFVYECSSCGIVISPKLLLLCEPQLEIQDIEKDKLKLEAEQ